MICSTYTITNPHEHNIMYQTANCCVFNCKSIICVKVDSESDFGCCVWHCNGAPSYHGSERCQHLGTTWHNSSCLFWAWPHSLCFSPDADGRCCPTWSDSARMCTASRNGSTGESAQAPSTQQPFRIPCWNLLAHAYHSTRWACSHQRQPAGHDHLPWQSRHHIIWPSWCRSPPHINPIAYLWTWSASDTYWCQSPCHSTWVSWPNATCLYF